MSTFTKRGASSSLTNLRNSSTRLPEGDAMQKPRTGRDLSAGFSAAARFKVLTSSRQIHVFIGAVRFDDARCSAMEAGISRCDLSRVSEKIHCLETPNFLSGTPAAILSGSGVQFNSGE